MAPKYKIKTVRGRDNFYFNRVGKITEASVNVYCHEIIDGTTLWIVMDCSRHSGGEGGRKGFYNKKLGKIQGICDKMLLGYRRLL